MQSFDNGSIDAVWSGTFFVVNLAYDVIYFVSLELWLWPGHRGPLKVVDMCGIVVWKKFVEEGARGLLF